MKLEITRGVLGQGYFYEITDSDGKILALGYYRLEKDAKFYGNLAMGIYDKTVTD